MSAIGSLNSSTSNFQITDDESGEETTDNEKVSSFAFSTLDPKDFQLAAHEAQLLKFWEPDPRSNSPDDELVLFEGETGSRSQQGPSSVIFSIDTKKSDKTDLFEDFQNSSEDELEFCSNTKSRYLELKEFKDVLFSHASIEGKLKKYDITVEELQESLSNNGWDRGKANMDLIEYERDKFTSLNNRRLYCLKNILENDGEKKLSVPVNIIPGIQALKETSEIKLFQGKIRKAVDKKIDKLLDGQINSNDKDLVARELFEQAEGNAFFSKAQLENLGAYFKKPNADNEIRNSVAAILGAVAKRGKPLPEKAVQGLNFCLKDLNADEKAKEGAKKALENTIQKPREDFAGVLEQSLNFELKTEKDKGPETPKASTLEQSDGLCRDFESKIRKAIVDEKIMKLLDGQINSNDNDKDLAARELFEQAEGNAFFSEAQLENLGAYFKEPNADNEIRSSVAAILGAVAKRGKPLPEKAVQGLNFCLKDLNADEKAKEGAKKALENTIQKPREDFAGVLGQSLNFELKTEKDKGPETPKASTLEQSDGLCRDSGYLADINKPTRLHHLILRAKIDEAKILSKEDKRDSIVYATFKRGLLHPFPDEQMPVGYKSVTVRRKDQPISNLTKKEEEEI